MTKLSVIVPNYNHARYLPARLDSILSQTRGDFELLVLDDCSPDNSRDVIRAYAARDPRLRFHCNEVKSGLAGVCHDCANAVIAQERRPGGGEVKARRHSFALRKAARLDPVILGEAGRIIARELSSSSNARLGMRHDCPKIAG